MGEQPANPPSDQPGKTRTWWHPLLVRLLQHELSGAYDVREEVPVGKVPLRLDVVLIRRGDQQFATWLIETDGLAGPGEPILTLFSRVFLRNRQHIMNQLRAAGFHGLLYYVLQQIEQFRAAGEPFMIQNKDLEVMDEVEKDLRAAVLKAMSIEQRLEGLSAEQILRVIPPEKRLQSLSADEIAAALSEQQLARLGELLEQRKANREPPRPGEDQ
jgi:hypothetical protein